MAGLGDILSKEDAYLLTGAEEEERESFANSLLNEDEQSMHPDIQDRVCKAIAKKIFIEDRGKFGIFKEFGPKPGTWQHYFKQGMEWMSKCKYFLGEHVHHDPSVGELTEEMQKIRLWDFYRAFFVLRYPDEVKYNGTMVNFNGLGNERRAA